MRVLKVSRRAGGSRPAIEFRLHAHLTVVRGLDDHVIEGDGPGCVAQLREPDQDLFR